MVFPKSNLPTDACAWGREIQKSLEDLQASYSSSQVNNAARDAQLTTSYQRLDAAVVELTSTTATAQAAADDAATAAATAQSAADAAAAAATDANDALNGLFGLSSAGSPYSLNASNIDAGTITASSVDLTTGSYGIKVGASGETAYLNCFVGSGDGTTFGQAGFSGSQTGSTPAVANTGWVAAFYPRNDGGPNLGMSGRRWNNVYAVNATINTSDAREKTDVEDSQLGLSFINDLRPVSYRRIDGDRTHYGLIAQEVEQVLVDNDITTQQFAGFVRGDVNDPESILGLRYSEFIAPMMKAIQELSARVETLENKLIQNGIE